jgi:hypothetical protein
VHGADASNSLKLNVLGLTAELAFAADKQVAFSPAMGLQDKKLLEEMVEEFRAGIAQHRARGTDEKRIRQILGEAIWLAFQKVKDPTLQAWICDQLTNAAHLAPIATNCPVSLTRH